MLIHRNKRADPTACSLQPEIWHVPCPLPLLQGPGLSGGQWFPHAHQSEATSHGGCKRLRCAFQHLHCLGNPVKGGLGMPALWHCFSRIPSEISRWNVLAGFSVAITPTLRNPVNLPRSRADTHNHCEATEQRRAGRELKKPLSSFIQKHFHLPITFHRSNFTSWRKYNIAD